MLLRTCQHNHSLLHVWTNNPSTSCGSFWRNFQVHHHGYDCISQVISLENHPGSSRCTSTANPQPLVPRSTISCWELDQPNMEASLFDGWANNNGCCTHPPQTTPRPFDRSSNPSGKASWIFFASFGGFTATRNGKPVSSIPRQSSWNWSVSILIWLPSAQKHNRPWFKTAQPVIPLIF